MQRSSTSAPLHPLLRAAACAALFSACGGGGDDPPPQQTGFTLFTTNQSAAASTRVVFSGTWIAFLADEATTGLNGTDLNGDQDLNDAVPVAINADEGLEFLVPAAARDLAWIGTELYLVVDEAQDLVDWNGDALQDDLVLLHWKPNEALAFVDALDARGTLQMIAAGGSLFFASAQAQPGGMGSSLKAIASSAPLAPRPVLTTDATGTLHPVLLAADEGLLLLALDETVELRDLNGDLDADDRRVLALLDGTGTAEGAAYSLSIQLPRLAARSQGELPFRALSKGANDWLAAFLVNETAQGATNFNDPNNPAAELPPSWLPPQCATPDVDVLDDVLFFVRFAAFAADPLANAPVNTGLVGEDRVAIAGDFVATVSPESDEGSCALNGDGDQADRIFRWVRAATPVTPPTDVELLRAVADLPGGAHAAAELQGRFVIAVNEIADGRDIDADALLSDAAFVGWLAPDGTLVWTFDHEPDQGESYGIATWIGEIPGRERLGIAFEESSNGLDINGDGDLLDAIPTFAQFAGSPVELRFPGFGAACPAENPGIVVQNGWALYRVSEAEDALDWSEDGNLNDFVLLRSNLSGGTTRVESVLNDIPGRPAVEPDDLLTPPVGAFIADESTTVDLNGDANPEALVLRYFFW